MRQIKKIFQKTIHLFVYIAAEIVLEKNFVYFWQMTTL